MTVAQRGQSAAPYRTATHGHLQPAPGRAPRTPRPRPGLRAGARRHREQRRSGRRAAGPRQGPFCSSPQGLSRSGGVTRADTQAGIVPSAAGPPPRRAGLRAASGPFKTVISLSFFFPPLFLFPALKSQPPSLPPSSGALSRGSQQPLCAGPSVLSQAGQAAGRSLRTPRPAHGGAARPRGPATRLTEGLQPPTAGAGSTAGPPASVSGRGRYGGPARSSSTAAPARGWAWGPAARPPSPPPRSPAPPVDQLHAAGTGVGRPSDSRRRGRPGRREQQGNMQPFWAEADKEPQPPPPLRRPPARPRPHLQPRPAAPRRPPLLASPRPPRRAAAGPLPPDSQLSGSSHLPCLL